MTAKEYLSQYRRMKYDAIRHEADYKELMSVLDIASVDYSAVKVQTSQHDQYADIISKAQEHLEALRSNMTSLFLMREQILMLVEFLPDSRYKAVITERYINGMTFDEIALSIGRTRRTAERINGEALRLLDEIMETHKIKMVKRVK